MKKLIFCFDGTGNEAEDANSSRSLLGLGGIKDASITNILKLHLLLGGNLKTHPIGQAQMSFYYSGVGTYGGLLQKIRNRIFAPED